MVEEVRDGRGQTRSAFATGGGSGDGNSAPFGTPGTVVVNWNTITKATDHGYKEALRPNS